jgi:hypothetical protein
MNKLVNSKLTRALLALMFAMSLAMLTGCEDQGPAEEAGENIDEAVEEAGDNMEEAAEEVEDEVDDATGGG